jgi:hypothetical protein
MLLIGVIMAKGRFVSKQITIDKKVNDLKDPWSMLGFTWMIPHADCEGRLYGDPSVLKSIIFPRQNGLVTIEQVEQMACDWHNIGLIIYYEDDCDRYIQLINFEKHQTGLRKDREPASVIPGFNPDNCRIIAGLNQVKLSISLSEVKDKLSKEDATEISPIQLMIEHEIGIMPSGVNDIKAMEEMELMHPTKEDIHEAAEWLRGQGKTIRYYSSLTECVRTAIAKRVQPKKQTIQSKNDEILQRFMENANGN